MFSAPRRSDALVFALALVGMGYFHQGGGWNQNARFALVRSIVERGSFFVDDYLLYEKTAGDDVVMRRTPVRHGNFTRGGADFALAWRGEAGRLLPVDPLSAGSRKLVAVDDLAASGDLAYYDGHFHPNKAPGTSLMAVPGYALVRGLEALADVSPDSWAALTIGAWLTSLLSVGLATALGAVMVLRLGRFFGSEASARGAALSFVFATMAWPCGTFLVEHNMAAAALVGAAYAIESARRAVETASRDRAAFAAGLAAGLAAITTYTVAPFVAVLALLLFAYLRSPRALACFAAGVLGPFALLCAYNVVCFGTPFTTNYAHENVAFQSSARFLGLFALPRMDVMVTLLFSPFRGLFFTSPVLLAAIASTVVLFRQAKHRLVAAFTLTLLVFLLLVNSSFNGWDGGWTAVPRYLGPAMGLVAATLAVAFDRWRTITSGLAAVSVVIQLLITAVDPQVPLGDVGTTGIAPFDVFAIDPMKRYVVPLFTSGRAWPILDQSIEQAVSHSVRAGLARDESTDVIKEKAAALREELHAKVERGEASPFPLAAITGPVSANPVAACEGSLFQFFAPGSFEAGMNSFNVGELLMPASRWSLLPLFLAASALLLALARTDEDIAVPAPPPPTCAPRDESVSAARSTSGRRTP